ncbi:MAG: PilW family protein [Gammaproteobacteria bacterium]
MLTMKTDSAGFTFVELMIALVISSFVAVTLITLFLANVNHYQKSLNANKLNQQLEAVLDIMATEIRRAGYWSNANSNVGIDANNNPFMASATDITVTNNNCILFTYDHNGTGSLPSVGSGTDDDRYGFQLSNNAIQERTNGASFVCPATDWENITDPNIISITALTFTLNTSTFTTGPGSRGLSMRSVDITVTGQLVSDATVTKTLTQHVRIRNDKFLP